MSKRTVAILLAAFVVLLVLVLVGQRSGTSPAGTGAPLVRGPRRRARRHRARDRDEGERRDRRDAREAPRQLGRQPTSTATPRMRASCAKR